MGLAASQGHVVIFPANPSKMLCYGSCVQIVIRVGFKPRRFFVFSYMCWFCLFRFVFQFFLLASTRSIGEYEVRTQIKFPMSTCDL